MRYQDGVNAADRVEIGIANPDLRWLQEHIRGLGFQPFPTGLKVGGTGHRQLRARRASSTSTTSSTLALGYAPDPLEDVFEGEVTGVEVTFPIGGMPTMTLVAHDYLHRLSQGTRGARFRAAPRLRSSRSS